MEMISQFVNFKWKTWPLISFDHSKLGLKVNKGIAKEETFQKILIPKFWNNMKEKALKAPALNNDDWNGRFPTFSSSFHSSLEY